MAVGGTPLGVGSGTNYYDYEAMPWQAISATATLFGVTATATATPIRQVSYTTNVGVNNPDWFTQEVLSQRDEVPVAEVQSVIIN